MFDEVKSGTLPDRIMYLMKYAGLVPSESIPLKKFVPDTPDEWVEVPIGLRFSVCIE